MNGREFAGTGEVFRFTLKQYLKAKSTLVSMIVLLIGLMGAVFIAAYSTQGGTGDLSVQQVALVNRTGIPVSVEEIAAADEGLQGLTETGLDQAQAVITLGRTRRDTGFPPGERAFLLTTRPPWRRRQ